MAIEELIGATIALGAAHVGGPLSGAEKRLAGTAAPVAVEGLRSAIRRGEDPLGDAFLRLRAASARRRDGAFYTPPAIVEPMVNWALEQRPTRLVDPGCGSGRFALAALRRDAGIEILAIDLDPLATIITRANLAAVGARHATVLNANYLTARLPPHAGKTAWVGNPPYVRHHDLDERTKAWAIKTAKRLNHSISGLAGLHALFFLATAVHAKPGDIGSFVTSAEWLDVSYGSVVRNLMLNGLGGRSLDLFDPRSVPFADAMTTALITSFSVGALPAQLAVKLLSDDGDFRLGDGTQIDVKVFSGASRWSPLFRAVDAQVGQVLGDLARVHRGVATGDNGFFTMTKAEARKRGLEAWAKSAITSAEEIIESDGVVRDSPQRRVLIDLPAVPREDLPTTALAYVKAGEKAGAHRRYLCAHRRPWWRLSAAAPPIVASYMARRPPAFALNQDGLVILNVAHGIWPAEGVEAARLVERLNGARQSFVGSGRTYHGGLEKFEPREMEALVLP